MGHRYTKFHEMWTCIFKICEWTNRQKHTHMLIAILHTSTMDKVMMYCDILTALKLWMGDKKSIRSIEILNSNCYKFILSEL